jgi:hypothetical protein
VTDRRQVRVTDQFLRSVIDALAEDHHGVTLPVADVDDVRMLITSGIMVAFIVVYVVVAADGGIEIVSLHLER